MAQVHASMRPRRVRLGSIRVGLGWLSVCGGFNEAEARTPRKYFDRIVATHGWS